MTTNNSVNVGLSGSTGSGSFVGSTSPNLVTPGLGAASATSINFGQTSLNFYEEGSWTPVDNSGASLTFTSVAANYTRIGRIVIATCTLIYPSTVSGSSASIGGLPYTISNTYEAGGVITYSTAATLSRCLPVGTTKTFNLYTAAGAPITNATLTLSTNYFQITYFV
jgi:hypothetical protein